MINVLLIELGDISRSQWRKLELAMKFINTSKAEAVRKKSMKLDVRPADVLEEILRFIYRGDVSVMDLKEGAADILVAAEKYALVDLKEMCEESLGVHMTVGNVLDMVELADLHNATMLRAMALRFIGENAKEVSAQKEWRKRIPGVMADIIDAIIQKGH